MSRILIADDNPISLHLFASLLREHGYECRTAVDGLAAVQLARDERFDLLLFDLEMPQLGGREALLRIRGDADASSQYAVAVATSAELDKATKRELRAAGFGAALPKPIDSESLRRAIATALGAVVESSGQGELAAATEARARDMRCFGAAAGSAFVDPGTNAVLLDEAQALAACGDADVVQALRTLFAVELDTLPEELRRYAISADADALRERLHRLRASCGFCGASALNEACNAFRETATVHDQERRDAGLRHLLAVAQATRAALP